MGAAEDGGWGVRWEGLECFDEVFVDGCIEV